SSERAGCIPTQPTDLSTRQRQLSLPPFGNLKSVSQNLTKLESSKLDIFLVVNGLTVKTDTWKILSPSIVEKISFKGSSNFERSSEKPSTSSWLVVFVSG